MKRGYVLREQARFLYMALMAIEETQKRKDSQGIDDWESAREYIEFLVDIKKMEVGHYENTETFDTE
jgi:hypothetical protein